MVTSEHVMTFIKKEMRNAGNSEICSALEHVARIIEAETHAELVREQMEISKSLNSLSSTGFMSGGGVAVAPN